MTGRDYEKIDLDVLQEEVLGGMSRYQLLLCIGVAFLSFSTAPCTQLGIYFSAVPEKRCAVPPLSEPRFNLTNEQIKNFTTPKTSSGEYDSCARYDQNLTVCDKTGGLSCLVVTNQTIPCDKGYVYERDVYTETPMSEFNTVCDKKISDTIMNSFFFGGYFVGSVIHGPISDRFGRKISLIFFWILYFIIHLSLAYAPSYEVYAFLRASGAVAIVGCYVAPYVYAMEMSTSRQRTNVGIIVAQSASLGHTLLAALAYGFRDWRSLELAVWAFSVPFVLIFFVLPESPRWLMSCGRNDEAKKVIQRCARSQKRILKEDLWTRVVEHEEKKRERSQTKDEKYGYTDLFSSRRMRAVTYVMFFSWFAVNMLFSGLTLNVGSLAGDPYTNALANAAIELVANMAVLLTPYTGGKKKWTYMSFLLAGLCCLGSTACIELAGENSALLTFSVVLALIGKFLATACWTLLYNLTAEVYPTVIRGTGLSFASTAARIGGVLTPWSIYLQEVVPWLTQTIFGLVAIVAFVACLFLPESDSSQSFETMLDAEEYLEENMTFYNKFFGGEVRKPLREGMVRSKSQRTEM